MQGQTLLPANIPPAPIRPVDAAAALAWLVQAGVDTAVDATPRRWLDAPPPRRVQPAPPPAAIQSRPATAKPATPRPPAGLQPAPRTSATLPAAIVTLADLDAAVAGFDHPLRRSDLAPHLLVGNPDSRVIILCDQPEPDMSPAALLRTRMLAAIGLDTGNCALLHRIPWPMPGGRSPGAAELGAFTPFCDRGLAIMRPRAVLALGQLAAGLAGEAMARASARGRWADLGVGETMVPLLATCHPRLLLNQPQRKRDAWTDLQDFAARLAVSA